MRGRVMQGNRYGRAMVAAFVTASLILPGCVKKPQKDAFFEHWDTQANKSEGFTPTARPRKVEVQEAVISKKEDKREAKPTRPLPKQKVTLRMYDTELVAVVRAMARAAGQNVVLASSIPGSSGAGQGQEKGGLRINVNVENAPWDEAFKSILATNGLTYAIDGEIITVMTLADMEQQSKMQEAKNKILLETAKEKNLEPISTYKIDINYTDLFDMYYIVQKICGNVGMSKSKSEQENKASSGTTDRTNISTSSVLPALNPQGALDEDYRRPGTLQCYVAADQHSNALVVQATKEDAEQLLKVIEKLDQPRPQIRLKAFIVQTDRSTAQQLGIQWGGLLKNSNFQMSPAQAGTITSTTTTGNAGTTAGTAITTYPATTVSGTTTNIQTNSTGTNTNNTTTASANAMTPIFGGGTSGQGFAINNPASLTSAATGLGASGTALNFLFGKLGENVIEAQLTALAEDNKVKILSSPTITTMENKEAYTENGKKIPYVSTSQNGTNVQFADALLRLEMLPHVIDGANLRMRIVVKDDQVDENQSNWVQGNPPIYKRETRTTLVVEDGDTIVISGLTRDTVTDGQSGVPFLRDIPGLGWAFKSKSSSIEREQILIFVTPTILKEKPVAPVPPLADHVAPQAAGREPMATAEAVKP
ncbi:secretin N-terminal domain-containing protein [Solidesulfovibrio sp.]|uniref:secretin N-terminal domain-containing protein n=1 Tax=Solidesulfovibrio sp. TaxID=2910990 RepID=UPI002B1ED699|nr:secretin and TonB N-terminal domain-containing protein [Solidesulfovibrio sp.]MEA4856761.1 secretin and TonB N-terminal domain-containing protein [Solidesulfovibrio sp.]